jgi:hypothetical protein
VKEIEATVRYANYDRLEEESQSGEGKKKFKKAWTRVPMPPATEVINLEDGSLLGDGIAVKDAGGLRLEGQIGEISDMTGVPAGTRAVSVFVVNRRAPDNAPGFRDRAYAFQVELELCCKGGFFGRPDCSGLESDEADERIGDLQYRDVLEAGKSNHFRPSQE